MYFVKNLHSVNLKLLKKLHVTHFKKIYKISDLILGDVFSIPKLLCENKHNSVANEKSYFSNKHKMRNCFEKVITHF